MGAIHGPIACLYSSAMLEDQITLTRQDDFACLEPYLPKGFLERTHEILDSPGEVEHVLTHPRTAQSTGAA